MTFRLMNPAFKEKCRVEYLYVFKKQMFSNMFLVYFVNLISTTLQNVLLSENNPGLKHMKYYALIGVQT